MGHLVEKYHLHDTPTTGMFDDGDIWQCACGVRLECVTGQYDTFRWAVMTDKEKK